LAPLSVAPLEVGFTKLGYTKPSTELRVDRVLDIAEVCYVFFSDMVYC